MRARGASNGRRARILTVVAVATALVGCGGDDDGADGTLDAISGSGAPGTTTAAPGGGAGAGGAPTTVAAAEAGTGFVSLTVEVAAEGITETISLDRSTVAAASLDPVSLDAVCTPLDGGDAAAGVQVSVVDLRRLAGDRLVSAVLQYPDGTPGEHDMSLQLGGADQVTTGYTGTVTVHDGGLSGTFEGTDAGGAAASGSFVCSTDALVTTTTAPPPDPGEEVPNATDPTTTVPAATTTAAVTTGAVADAAVTTAAVTTAAVTTTTARPVATTTTVP